MIKFTRKRAWFADETRNNGLGMFGVKGKIRMNVGIIKYHHSSHLSLC